MNEYMKEAERLLDEYKYAAGPYGHDIIHESARTALLAHIQRGAAEHPLEDVRCGCCGYMTYHREHMGCIRAATTAITTAEVPMPEPDATLCDDGYFVAKYQLRTSYEFGRAGWRLDVISTAKASTYGDAREAAGYARVLEWAVSGWKAEVENRPLENKNRRSLDDVWRQVVRFAGGDPDALLGPSHDAALRGEVKS